MKQKMEKPTNSKVQETEMPNPTIQKMKLVTKQ